EDDVETIRVTRFEPIGVIVQTTFWLETYKKIMARILERFANVQIRNTACIDSLQRLPEVEKLAKQVDAIIIFGWTEGMTTRMIEVARAFIRTCTRSKRSTTSGWSGCGEKRQWVSSAPTRPPSG